MTIFVFKYIFKIIKQSNMPNNLNSGALFKNENSTSDKAPGYTGTANIGGKEWRIAAWVQQGTNGRSSFFSFKFEEPQASTAKPAPKPVAKGDDDLPF